MMYAPGTHSETLHVVVPTLVDHQDDQRYLDELTTYAIAEVDLTCRRRAMHAITSPRLIWSGTLAQATANGSDTLSALRNLGIDPYGGDVDGVSFFLFAVAAAFDADT